MHLVDYQFLAQFSTYSKLTIRLKYQMHEVLGRAPYIPNVI